MGNRGSNLSSLIGLVLAIGLAEEEAARAKQARGRGGATSGIPGGSCLFEPTGDPEFDTFIKQFLGGDQEGVKVYTSLDDLVSDLQNGNLDRGTSDGHSQNAGNREISRVRKEAQRQRETFSKFAADLGNVLHNQVQTYIQRISAAKADALAAIAAASNAASGAVTTSVAGADTPVVDAIVGDKVSIDDEQATVTAVDVEQAEPEKPKLAIFWMKRSDVDRDYVCCYAERGRSVSQINAWRAAGWIRVEAVDENGAHEWWKQNRAGR